MAENSPIGSEPTTSFNARVGAAVELTKSPTTTGQPDVGLSSTKAWLRRRSSFSLSTGSRQ